MAHLEDLTKTGDLGKTITLLKAIIHDHEERIKALESQPEPKAKTKK